MKTPLRFLRDQSGSIAVQIGIASVVLFGFVGLVVDLGRTYTLHTELQQAADAAALAAAAELDGFSGAQTRAKAAVTAFGTNNQTFATDNQGSAISLATPTFLSAIAATNTIIPPQISPAGDTAATGDGNSFYVQIQAKSRSVTGSLASFVTNNSIFSTTAVSTAGRIPLACLDVPLATCSPFSDTNGNPFGTGGLRIGDEVQVTCLNGTCGIGSGDQGVVCPPQSGNCPKGTGDTYLGTASVNSPTVAQCTNSNTPYTTSPGNHKGGQFDTRFGVGSTASEPPSININEYSADSAFTTTTSGNRASTVLGNGNWSWQAYMFANHPTFCASPTCSPPAGMATDGPGGIPTRYDVYNWENTNNQIPGGKQTSPGTPTADRRLMYIAVMDCSVNGRRQFGAVAYFTAFLPRKFNTSLTDPNDPANTYVVEVQTPLSFSNANGPIHNHVQLVR